MRLRLSNGTSGCTVGFNKYQSNTYLDYAEGNTAKHATTISLDEWHEIKMYFDSTSQTIVLDENTIVNNASLSTISAANNSMFAQNSNTTYGVEFYVDEFKLYDLGA